MSETENQLKEEGKNIDEIVKYIVDINDEQLKEEMKQKIEE